MDVEKLELSESDKSSGIGFLKQHSVYETYPAHTHDFYEIFLVTKGKAIHVVNGITQLVTRGSFVFIRPEDMHYYDYFKTYDFEFMTLGIPISEMENIFAYLNLSFDILLSPIEAPNTLLEGSTLIEIEKKLEGIGKQKIGEERHSFFLAVMPWLTYKLYQYMSEDSHKLVVPSWFIQLIGKMGERDNYVLGLVRMLELANYSQEHLTRLFRKYLDLTPTEFINEKRMQYAVELLQLKQYDVLEICHMSGCNNLSHFYHLFKKTYGCSPKEYVK